MNSHLIASAWLRLLASRHQGPQRAPASPRTAADWYACAAQVLTLDLRHHFYLWKVYDALIAEARAAELLKVTP